MNLGDTRTLSCFFYLETILRLPILVQKLILCKQSKLVSLISIDLLNISWSDDTKLRQEYKTTEIYQLIQVSFVLSIEKQVLVFSFDDFRTKVFPSNMNSLGNIGWDIPFLKKKTFDFLIKFL